MIHRILMCLLACVACAADARADAAAKDPVATARRILAEWNDPQIGKTIDEFGETIAVRPDEAEAVVQMLSSDRSIEAATLRAELLVWIARGDETPSWKLKKMEIKPRPMETDRFGSLASELLSHPDPFIRGLAEWAIAIRMHLEYECAEQRVDGRRVAKQWPDDDAPAWYRAWDAIGPDAMLELDYVRQAAALGVHRTTANLLDAGERLVERSKNLVAYAGQSGGDSQAPYSPATRHERVLVCYGGLQEAAETSPADLGLQRRLYLDLRRAVRDVVLASPDIDFDRVVFGVRQAPPSNGNITVGRWNTHTPGGDIYVKQGLAPSDPDQTAVGRSPGAGSSPRTGTLLGCRQARVCLRATERTGWRRAEVA